MINRSKTITLFATAGLLFFSTSANAASYHHIDSLAVRVVKNTEKLFRLLRSDYRHTSDYRHLIHDTRELRSRAYHIHDVAHHGGSVDHLASDIREMDRLFHHLEDVLTRVESNSRYCDFHGRFRGNSRLAWALMHAIEDDLHHLGEDVEGLRTRRSGYRGGIVNPGVGLPPIPVPGPRARIAVPAPVRSTCPNDRYGRAGFERSIPTPFGFFRIGF